MKYSKDIYEAHNPFLDCDRDVDIKMWTWKLVKTRKIHKCMLSNLVDKEIHEIQIGDMALYEHALVDGEWGSSYSCIECMDIWLDEEYYAVLD